MVTPPPGQSERVGIEVNASACQAHSSTFRIVNETDPAGGGTAVAINIGSRFFLATARHVIREGEDVRVVLRACDESVSQFAARHVHRGADVGILELRQEDVPRFGGAFVTPDRLIANLDQRVENSVAVIGYPAGLMSMCGSWRMGENESIEIWRIAALTFLSTTLPLRDWPASDTLNPTHVDRDLFIDFDPESRLYPLLPSGAGTSAPAIEGNPPAPPGISGGGIWLMQVREESGLGTAGRFFAESNPPFTQGTNGCEAFPSGYLWRLLNAITPT